MDVVIILFIVFVNVANVFTKICYMLIFVFSQKQFDNQSIISYNIPIVRKKVCTFMWKDKMFWKNKKFWYGVIGTIIALSLIIILCAGNYLVTYALYGDEQGHIGSMGSDVYTGIQDSDAQVAYDNWVKNIEVEEWTITSNDDLKLSAQFYKNPKSTHRYVLALHGYTVDHRDIMPAAYRFAEKEFHILAPDQRGRGNSEGNYLGMGWLEKDDVKIWIDKILAQDEQAEIVLYGESMGAATLMMSVGEALPDNVKLLIEDCGYTSAYGMFKAQLKERFHLPSFPFLPIADMISSIRAGYSFSSADALKQLEKATLPILFIHGDADDYVPTEMGVELYEAYTGEKELLLIEGAGHGASSDVDPNMYYEHIFAFIDTYMK